MYLFDTDITSNLLDARRGNAVLRERVRNTPLDTLAISIVTVDEMLRGALDRIRRLQTQRKSVIPGYDDLLLLFTKLQRFPVIPYSNEAEVIFNAFPAPVKRNGVNDCRIAAIALAHDCTLVTANTTHFLRIPPLRVEDWTLV